MPESEPPPPANWADFIDALHVFNPPTLRGYRDERRGSTLPGVTETTSPPCDPSRGPRPSADSPRR